MSERLVELMATLRAPIRRDWKEMRRAFRVRQTSHMTSILMAVVCFLFVS